MIYITSNTVLITQLNWTKKECVLPLPVTVMEETFVMKEIPPAPEHRSAARTPLVIFAVKHPHTVSSNWLLP